MNPSERKLLVEELCDAMGRVVDLFFAGVNGYGAVCHTANQSRTTGDTLNALEGKGTLLQLQEKCAAFLREPVVKRDAGPLPYEQLLPLYPTLAAVRVRHVLVREYLLIAEEKVNHGGFLHRRSSSFMEDKCKANFFFSAKAM
ncbi:hypothetical protein TraAM80_00485 [Trypanosoma rangeli]|uniref:Uncharacterized protein n=1 Tax=Trypanosoma rangeli TaxID=5698 RepID=A0A3R7KRJ5_TRYRA|nr:uncharacterized protein TraAM80_00485 [Trypanosoma rangeli]RNF12203.1 hypothetical protein TraAM80_00485 [Trypanosoma rangeli]|eukprot:RNF12203.1 hypothetical protein TraAM80_00485 [Trypanosoma rangeli]